jgi:hypothetical protein
MLRIEEIDALRRQCGIDDVELRRQVAALRVGDQARLTFLAGPGLSAPLTLRVRITHIRGDRFHGLLAEPNSGRVPPAVQDAMPVVFTAGQIHSVVSPGSAAASQGHRPRKKR